MPPRWDARTDATQTPIATALRKAGCLVFLTHRVGKGFPDAVVWVPRWKQLVFAELKTGKAGLNKAQQVWHVMAKKAGMPVYIWRTAGEALDDLAR